MPRQLLIKANPTSGEVNIIHTGNFYLDLLTAMRQASGDPFMTIRTNPEQLFRLACDNGHIGKFENFNPLGPLEFPKE